MSLGLSDTEKSILLVGETAAIDGVLVAATDLLPASVTSPGRPAAALAETLIARPATTAAAAAGIDKPLLILTVPSLLVWTEPYPGPSGGCKWEPCPREPTPLGNLRQAGMRVPELKRGASAL
jgi:hypothetical protein